jgi:hypothetical protein
MGRRAKGEIMIAPQFDFNRMFRSVFLEGNRVICRVRCRDTFDILWEHRQTYPTHDSAWAAAERFKLGQPSDEAVHPDGQTPAEARRTTLFEALTIGVEEVRDEDILEELGTMDLEDAFDSLMDDESTIPW